MSDALSAQAEEKYREKTLKKLRKTFSEKDYAIELAATRANWRGTVCDRFTLRSLNLNGFSDWKLKQVKYFTHLVQLHPDPNEIDILVAHKHYEDMEDLDVEQAERRKTYEERQEFYKTPMGCIVWFIEGWGNVCFTDYNVIIGFPLTCILFVMFVLSMMSLYEYAASTVSGWVGSQ
jgi:hypothetical protein